MTQSGKNIIIAQNQLNKMYLNNLQQWSTFASILLSMKNATKTDINTPVERVQVAKPKIKVARTICFEDGR